MLYKCAVIKRSINVYPFHNCKLCILPICFQFNIYSFKWGPSLAKHENARNLCSCNTDWLLPLEMHSYFHSASSSIRNALYFNLFCSTKNCCAIKQNRMPIECQFRPKCAMWNTPIPNLPNNTMSILRTLILFASIKSLKFCLIFGTFSFIHSDTNYFIFHGVYYLPNKINNDFNSTSNQNNKTRTLNIRPRTNEFNLLHEIQQ